MRLFGPQAINWGQPVNRSCPLNRGLLAWWLCRPESTIASGKLFGLEKKYVASPTNSPTIQTAMRPGGMLALELTGASSQYVQSDSVISTTNAARTVSIWIYPTSSSRMGVIGTRSASSGWNLSINRTTAGNITYIQNSSASPEVAGGVTTNQWQCIAFTATASNASVIIYRNGLQVGTSGAGISESAGIAEYIGHDNAANYYSGRVDDARIWNRTLSANEIYSVYRDSLTGYQQTLNRFSRPLFNSASAAATFNPAWARNATQLVGSTSYA